MSTSTCPYIILLSGTPGTGKTTISNALSKQYKRKIFQLGDYILKNKLYSAEGEKSVIKTIDSNKAAKSSAIEVLSKYRSCDVVIIDSHYADIFMDGLLEIQGQRDYNCAKSYTQGENIFGVICRCHPNILKQRLTERNYSNSKINENIQAEILAESTQNMVEVLPKESILEIDTTNVSVNDIVQVINQFVVQKLQRKEFKNDLLKPIGIIDWIFSLSKNNELNDFFKEDYGERTEYDLDDILKQNDTGRWES